MTTASVCFRAGDAVVPVENDFSGITTICSDCIWRATSISRPVFPDRLSSVDLYRGFTVEQRVFVTYGKMLYSYHAVMGLLRVKPPYDVDWSMDVL